MELPKLFLLLACGTAAALSADEQRVRVSEPTVVTVRGKTDEVPPEQAERRQKVDNPVIRGVRIAGRGIAAAAGWLLNSDDDISAERPNTIEKRRSEQPLTR